jgi:hypothetical protein
MTAEELDAALSFEFAVMATDPIVIKLKKFILESYRATGQIVRTVPPEQGYVYVMHNQNSLTGDHYYSISVHTGRQLKFIIKKEELEAVRGRT